MARVTKFMDLILWRHAEAAEGTSGIADGKCRLTTRGKKQTQQMAEWLKAQRLTEVRVLSSPAERAQQTAHALDLPYEVKAQLAVVSP
jgi:phosphohistidine phosphatase